MKYYLIAGERSGDLHASNLMKSLLQNDPEAEFRFFGGDYMEAVGGHLVAHYKELAFMGFIEVVKNLRTIRQYTNLCKNDIITFNPDAIILIDYAGFNLRIAKFARQKNIKVYYYISPKIWAWNQKRAYKIKKYVDHMFAIMPFEVDFYKKFGYKDVSYVGNPVVDAIGQYNLDQDFLTSRGIEKNSRKLIAVLPGSRAQELAHILPTITEVIKRNKNLIYLVGVVDNLPEALYEELADLENVKLISGNTYDILAHADAAIVTSGTATLEAALWNTPQVVVYKGSKLSIFIAKTLIKVRYISLVNLILDEDCIVELIQENCSVEKVEVELNKILETPTDYSKLKDAIGDHHASENAARGITSMLEQTRI